MLLTGHTGFKGSWLSSILLLLGAELSGYALAPQTEPALYSILDLGSQMNSVIADIRNLDALAAVFEKVRPEVVLHLAAQPLVRESYLSPRETYETNVMGTVNVLECVRNSPSVRSFLNVTTDKVYENKEWEWGYRENETLNGFDPYSNSKSCSELVTQCYRNSFFSGGEVKVSTARAGNVIGGGDFSKDRIIPDCIRAALDGNSIVVRNPFSTRPYQHVLEPLFAYLMIAANQWENPSLAGNYNVGPDEEGFCQTGCLVDMFCKSWGEGINWVNQSDNGPHEANFLKLDCSKIKKTFKWKPQWVIQNAVQKTVDWSKSYRDGESPSVLVLRQIHEYAMLLGHDFSLQLG